MSQPNPSHQQYPLPPIVINNSSSASSSARSGGGYCHGHHYRHQSVAVHVFLFLLTAGIGNAVYAVMIHNENRRNGYR
ncbi:hypothetical protein [Kitasatospora sp. McL0602]|uniref:hypothetical protein n=1 Tax=Kitasatospora sp. McL0602 TaxID=3439530 RepID=UPI003F8B968A